MVDSLSDIVLRPLINVKHEDVAGCSLRILAAVNGDPVLATTTLAVVPGELEPGARDQAGRQGLKLAGPAARYLAADWPIEAAVAVALTGPVAAARDTLPAELDPAVMVYRWSKDEWKPVGRLLEPKFHGSDHRFALSSPGLHAVFRDVTAPVIFPADTVIIVASDPRGQVHGVTLPRWEIFPVELLDPGSGLAPESITATLDGQPIIVEPDLVRDRVLVELSDHLGPGRHVLFLKAADETGNETEAEILIECRD